jgi:hypothetical protein
MNLLKRLTIESILSRGFGLVDARYQRFHFTFALLPAGVCACIEAVKA